MRKPRVRFREFLLIVTLASLVTAAVAIRTGATDRLIILDHVEMAGRARRIAKTMADGIPEAIRLAEESPALPPGAFANFRVEFVPAVADPSELSLRSRSLIIVTEVYGLPWLRIFDADGKIIGDGVRWGHPQVEYFMAKIEQLRPPHELTDGERDWIVAMAEAFVNENRKWVRRSPSLLETRRDEAIAEAESHERLSRRP